MKSIFNDLHICDGGNKTLQAGDKKNISETDSKKDLRKPAGANVLLGTAWFSVRRFLRLSKSQAMSVDSLSIRSAI